VVVVAERVRVAFESREEATALKEGEQTCQLSRRLDSKVKGQLDELGSRSSLRGGRFRRRTSVPTNSIVPVLAKGSDGC
jgi:hypothetical protein